MYLRNEDEGCSCMPSKPSCIDRQLKRPFQIAKVLIIIESLKRDSFIEEVPRLLALVPIPQLFGKDKATRFMS